MKRFVIILTAFFIIFNSEASFAEENISAQSAIVMDCASGRVLFEKNAREKRGMASTTKIMTALLALEKLRMDSVVTVSPFASGTEGSSIWLAPGEHMSVSDLLYALMLASGNDAATALAEFSAGSVEAFTLMMNKKAREIGAYDTNFENPHGLPNDNHYTTAYDLALISAHAMKNPAFREIVSTERKVISWEGSEWDRSLKNHNKLLSLADNCIGIKTGFTKKDGRCLVSAFEKDGATLICVTLSDPDDWNDHINLTNDIFSKYFARTVCKEGESAGKYILKGANRESIDIYYGESYTTLVSESEKDRISVKPVFNPSYPVKKGDKVGELNIFYDNALVGKVSILSDDSADLNPTFFGVLKNLTKGLIKI